MHKKKEQENKRTTEQKNEIIRKQENKRTREQRKNTKIEQRYNKLTKQFQYFFDLYNKIPLLNPILIPRVLTYYFNILVFSHSRCTSRIKDIFSRTPPVFFFQQRDFITPVAPVGHSFGELLPPSRLLPGR